MSNQCGGGFDSDVPGDDAGGDADEDDGSIGCVGAPPACCDPSMGTIDAECEGEVYACPPGSTEGACALDAGMDATDANVDSGFGMDGPVECGFPEMGTNIMPSWSFEDPDAFMLAMFGSRLGWHGDLARSLSVAEAAMPPLSITLTPPKGDRVLVFLASRFDGATTGGAAQVVQPLDLTPFLTEIGEGRVTIHAAVKFNRVPGDAETDTAMDVRVTAYPGDLEALPFVYMSPIADERDTIITDSDLSTWECAATEIALPAETTHVLVWLDAQENVVNDPVEPEFDGHFADDVGVWLEIAPP